MNFPSIEFGVKNLGMMNSCMLESWALLAEGSNYSAIVAFSIYIVLVFVLAILSNRFRQSKSFLSEYFLGSRTLGVWAFALTFAATSASGGCFMGFPVARLYPWMDPRVVDTLVI